MRFFGFASGRRRIEFADCEDEDGMRKRIWTRNEKSDGRCSGARSTHSFLSICQM